MMALRCCTCILKVKTLCRVLLLADNHHIFHRSMDRSMHTKLCMRSLQLHATPTPLTVGDVGVRGGGFVVATGARLWSLKLRVTIVRCWNPLWWLRYGDWTHDVVGDAKAFVEEMAMLCGCMCGGETMVVRWNEREEKGRRRGKGQIRKNKQKRWIFWLGCWCSGGTWGGWWRRVWCGACEGVGQDRWQLFGWLEGGGEVVEEEDVGGNHGH